LGEEPESAAPVAAKKRRTLADLEVPSLIDSQLARFTPESIQATMTRRFDSRAVLQTLSATAEAHVMAVDMGGDKLIAAAYAARGGVLAQEGPPLVSRGMAGAGYLDLLEEVAGLARARSLPMGISFAGPVQGSQILAGLNIPTFFTDFQSRYGGDFSRLYPMAMVVNDGEAGLIAAALEAMRHYPQTRNVLLAINGSGLNCATFKGDTILSAEAGHVAVEAELNPFGQTKPCGMMGATYVCLENVAASRAGIEDLWSRQRDEALSGREIAAAYRAGDELALQLYADSAWVTAHMVKGTAKALGVEEWDRTVVVGHGGTFRVPSYGEHLRAILEKELAIKTPLLVTADFSANACLDGAAIVALFRESLGGS
jgi:predicted NBD/HSP70 family sugar kinase